MQDANQLKYELSYFTGSETIYRHTLATSVVYTEGAKYFAENAGAGAYWFLDILATEVADLHGRGEDFIHIELKVDASVADITADDGNGNELWSRYLTYTDCPAGSWDFYQIWDGVYSVILLPSEY